MLFSSISRELEIRHLSMFRSVVAWKLINCVQHNRFHVIKQYYMVRSTLLWHRLLAAPKGEIGGVTGICGRDMVFSHFHVEKIKTQHLTRWSPILQGV